MTDKTVRMIIAGLLALALGFALNMTRLIIVAAGAEGHTHDGEVGKFYQAWMRPTNRNVNGERTMSCCGENDCHPVAQLKRNGENWFFYDAMYRQWVLIPPEKIEDNQPDPHDSPDGNWHVCNQGGMVYCAVRGSLQ